MVKQLKQNKEMQQVGEIIKERENKQKKKSKKKDRKSFVKTKDGLNLQQELFCQSYVSPDKDLFGNGTQSYIEAYGYRDEAGKVASNYNVIMACASRLLRNAKVIKRINELLDQGGFNDTNVDKQHLFLINQHTDFKTKMSAIKEYNLLRKRVDNRPQVVVLTPTDEERKKANDALEQFLKKQNDNPANPTIRQ